MEIPTIDVEVKTVVPPSQIAVLVLSVVVAGLLLMSVRQRLNKIA